MNNSIEKITFNEFQFLFILSGKFFTLSSTNHNDGLQSFFKLMQFSKYFENSKLF